MTDSINATLNQCTILNKHKLPIIPGELYCFARWNSAVFMYLGYELVNEVRVYHILDRGKIRILLDVDYLMRSSHEI